jgi:microsomal dipeptidase-like Zn-dependent dipeptidase
LTEGYANAKALTFDRLDEIVRQEKINGSKMAIAFTPDDIENIKAEGKKAVMLGVENGYAIGKDIRILDELKRKGVVYITLCHNGDNDICDSARGKGEWGGVSPFGKEVIKRMNDLGILVDLSHTSEKTFYDAIELSRVPVVCSHSSSRALCDHPRNLTDDQLKRIAEKGGVVQVCLYKGFISKDSDKANIHEAIKHINHLVEIMGIEHVGIGSDFDGDGGIPGCQSSNELINITMELLKSGYAEEDIAKIWGGNFMRVMRQAQAAAI